MSTREINKNVRRRAILDAAQALIQEGKSRDFSMPNLAKKAGVSLVTPYNLFGSKSNILLEICKADIFERATAIHSIPTDDLLEWVLQTSQTLGTLFYRGRHFFRRMTESLVTQESAEGMRELLDLSYRMFVEPIAQLQADRKIKPTVPADSLARQLARIVNGAVQHCLMERTTEERVRREIEAGLLLVIAGSARDADRTRLLDRAMQLEKNRNDSGATRR